jgi:hypothetical protein
VCVRERERESIPMYPSRVARSRRGREMPKSLAPKQERVSEERGKQKEREERERERERD